MNMQQVQRYVRRLTDSPMSRQLSRRVGIFVVLVLLFLMYFIYSSYTIKKTSPVQMCVADHFQEKIGKSVNILAEKSPISFIGNGYIGLDVSSQGLLLLKLNNTLEYFQLPGFLPLVNLITPNTNENALHFVSDVNEGMSRAVRCSIIAEKCICVYEYIYSHRTRRNVLIQDVKLSNPSMSTLDIKFLRGISSEWEKQEGAKLPIYYRRLNIANEDVGVAVVCSSLPENLIVNQKREENFRFICVVEHEKVGQDVVFTKRHLISKVLEKFSEINGMHHSKVDEEHKTAWATLNKASFSLSPSKAPNALNTELIELTKYLLLSAARDPLLEKDVDPKVVEEAKMLLDQNELCYRGHSTMLTPSKLWQYWDTYDDIQSTINIWILTLKHHGCMHLVNAGAHGLVQAFLLSLTAATFTHHHLEFVLDPTGDLHRHLHIEGLDFALGVSVSLDFDMDVDYRPLIRVKSTSSNVPLYACSGGCLDGAKQLTNTIIELPIKITKPPTPILFISDDKIILNTLKDTLHVIEVVDAPKHLAETIALHKHGENTGLPTVFWVILICLLASFHIFLFKLLYSEWKNSSSVPYSKFSKKILLRR